MISKIPMTFEDICNYVINLKQCNLVIYTSNKQQKELPDVNKELDNNVEYNVRAL
jgi:hypothetical protein